MVNASSGSRGSRSNSNSILYMCSCLPDKLNQKNIFRFRESCENSMKNYHILFTQIFQMLVFLFLSIIYLLLSISICFFPELFTSKVQIECFFTPNQFSLYFMKKKEKPKHNHNILIRIRILPIVSMFFPARENPESLVAFGCHISQLLLIWKLFQFSKKHRSSILQIAP